MGLYEYLALAGLLALVVGVVYLCFSFGGTNTEEDD